MRFLKYWFPVIAWAGIILAASTDFFSADSTGSWLETIFGRAIPESVNAVIRKLAHVVEYAILAGLASRALHHSTRALVSRVGAPSIATAIAVAVAITDETLQSRSANRTGTPWDVALDAAGAVLAAFIIIPMFRRSRRVREE